MHIEQKKSPNQHEKNMGRVKTKKPDPMDLIPGDMRDNLSFLLSMAKEITNAFEKGIADFSNLSLTPAFHHAIVSTPNCYKHLFSISKVKNELTNINSQFENAIEKAFFFEACCKDLAAAHKGNLFIDIDEMTVYFGQMIVYRDTTISPLINLLSERLSSFIGLMEEENDDSHDDRNCPCGSCDDNDACPYDGKD